MAGFPQIERWQLVVTNPGGKDALTCRFTLRQDAGEFDQGRFVQAFQARCKLRPALAQMEELPEGRPPARG